MTQPPPPMQQWIVRTQPLLSQIDTSLPPKQQMAQLASINQPILTLLPQSERDGVLKYFFPADAAMSLVSQLLKHLTIAESCSLPFSSTIVSRDPEHGKPCYKPPTDSSRSLSFNVSHQAGLVALIAIPEFVKLGQEASKYDVGIDIVCVNERNDLEKIMDSQEPRRAYNEFVGMHEEVFSPKEITALRMADISGESGRVTIERRLRRFFALWCLREAYVKMTGEALLAEWLQELEFRRFPVPDEEEEGEDGQEAMMGTQAPKTRKDVDGEFEIYLKGERARNVEMRIVALGKRYMVASAVRRKDESPLEVPWTELKEISVEEVVRRARAAV